MSFAQRKGGGSEPLGFLDTHAAGVINSTALSIGSIILSIAAVLYLLTFHRGSPLFTFGPVVVLFVTIFPLQFWTVIMMNGHTQRRGEPLLSVTLRRDRMRSKRLGFSFRNLPTWAFVLVVAVFLGSLCSGFFIFSGHDLPGQPSYDPSSHQYFANNHGQNIHLTESQYYLAVDAQNRLFLSAVIAFVSISVAATSDEVMRRRSSPYSQ